MLLRALRKKVEPGYALYVAAHDNNVTELGKLIREGAPVNYKNVAWFNATPLHEAAWNGSVHVLQLLLLAPGINVNDETLVYKSTPLHYACSGKGNKARRLEAAKLLLKAGADPLAKAQLGKTPADLANTTELRSLLLEAMKTDQSSMSESENAVMEGNSKQEASNSNDSDSDSDMDMDTNEEQDKVGTAAQRREKKEERRRKRDAEMAELNRQMRLIREALAERDSDD